VPEADAAPPLRMSVQSVICRLKSATFPVKRCGVGAAAPLPGAPITRRDRPRWFTELGRSFTARSQSAPPPPSNSVMGTSGDELCGLGRRAGQRPAVNKQRPSLRLSPLGQHGQFAGDPLDHGLGLVTGMRRA
jgi:hypothetical protein